MRRHADIVRRNPDQETNDQTKAVKYLAAKGIRRIVILGATGMREDHTLGNLSLLIDYLEQGIEARTYTDYLCGDSTLRCPVGTQISIFNFGATGLSAEGPCYHIRDFTSWWQGTLNETTSPTVTIRAHGPYLLFINYPPQPN